MHPSISKSLDIIKGSFERINEPYFCILPVTSTDNLLESPLGVRQINEFVSRLVA